MKAPYTPKPHAVRKRRRLIDEEGKGTEGKARPFSKSVGGKTQLLPTLLSVTPKTFKAYHEPFVGGGALFWALAGFRTPVLGTAFAPRWASLGDMNPEIVNAYVTVRDHVELLIAQLRLSQELYGGPDNSFRKDIYYATRALNPQEMIPVERAARFIFLNKTCFNGMYRVDQKNGRFNVPMGDYPHPLICDAANLRACSRALQGVEVHHRPFEMVLDDARRGDLVYLDPPYLPLSKTSSFTSYTSEGFRLEDHERLRDVASDLTKRGVHVVVSNSAAPEIVELYEEPQTWGDFTIQRVQAGRSVNSKASGRGKIEELVITSDPIDEESDKES